MNRCLRVLLLLAACAAAPCTAQEPAKSPPPCPIWQDPENHDIVVERLMRYHDYGEYDRQIREVANSAREYLRSVLKNRAPNEKLAAVFDIDETSLSNWKSMAACGFCSYRDRVGHYPDDHLLAIEPVRELFYFAKENKIDVFFVTGRQESERDATINNLHEAQYRDWTDLIMQSNEKKRPASEFKPAARQSILDRGYRIVLSIGDQASDLAGCCAERVFKLPNPFYLVK